MDAEYDPADIFAPLSANSSQLAAVLATQAGKEFVLFGPPGTGKSQTIANIIAQCLAHQRTVLFVSQKTAALEVVQRRLREIGLGDYCLEVHSTKAQKSEVLGQLKTSWHERKFSATTDWAVATNELLALRDELNGLVVALHGRHSNGMNAYEAFGRVVAYGDRYAQIRFDWPNHSEHSPATIADLRARCRELKTAVQAVGSVEAHSLTGIEAVVWSPAWRNELQTTIDDVTGHLQALKSSAATFTGLIIGPGSAFDQQNLGGMAALASHLSKSQKLAGGNEPF